MVMVISEADCDFVKWRVYSAYLLFNPSFYRNSFFSITAFIACCSVHTPSSNPNKPAPRHLSLPRNMSRRNRNSPTAPTDNSNEHIAYHRQGPSDGPPGYDTALRDRQHPGYEMRWFRCFYYYLDVWFVVKMWRSKKMKRWGLSAGKKNAKK